MTCAELSNRLEAYGRGALSREECERFEAHLTSCPTCSALLEAAEPRLLETGHLAPGIEPAANLWSGIATRLAPRGGGERSRRTRAVPGWMLAAAALLLIVVSSAVTAALLRRPPSRPPIQASFPVSPLESQYAAATGELASTLEKARTRLAPGTIAIIQRNLAVIDSALAESRRALANDPGNAALEELVVAVWRQKMDFLRRATALAPGS